MLWTDAIPSSVVPAPQQLNMAEEKQMATLTGLTFSLPSQISSGNSALSASPNLSPDCCSLLFQMTLPLSPLSSNLQRPPLAHGSLLIQYSLFY